MRSALLTLVGPPSPGLAVAGGVYHVTARGNERKAIVRDDRDRARWVDTLAQMVERLRRKQ